LEVGVLGHECHETRKGTRGCFLATVDDSAVRVISLRTSFRSKKCKITIPIGSDNKLIAKYVLLFSFRIYLHCQNTLAIELECRRATRTEDTSQIISTTSSFFEVFKAMLVKGSFLLAIKISEYRVHIVNTPFELKETKKLSACN
jgi:hypothetical protein